MSSDTPRTDAAYAAYFRPGATLYDFAGEMKNLERELNDTNAVSLRYAHEIDRLNEELEKHALTSSPALTQAQAQAQIEVLASTVRGLESEVERMEKQRKADNRSYGCELRDPYGTIWEQAEKDHARAERAEAELAKDKARLNWLEAHALAQHSNFVSIAEIGRFYTGFPGSLRAAIDAAIDASRERNTRSGHDPAKSGQAAEAAIDAEMKAMTPAPLDDFQNDNSYDLQDDNP